MVAESSQAIPPLSYVLVATTDAEVRQVAGWLFTANLSPQVEVVLAAPARVLAQVAARVIPPRVRLASATEPATINTLKMVGAAATSGLVVIVIECEGDFTSGIRDPFAALPEGPAGSPELARWADELAEFSR